MSKQEFRHFFFFASAAAAGLVFVTVVGLTYAGVIAPWSGRFYSLWDTGYAKIHIPIIASVSEHQPTTWFSLFFDLHILVVTFPVGIWFCIRKINDERVFSKLQLIHCNKSQSNFRSFRHFNLLINCSCAVRVVRIILCWCNGPSYFNANTVCMRPQCYRFLLTVRVVPQGR